MQTSILAAGQPVGFAGLVTHKVDSLSASNAEASAHIQFGIGVKPGSLVKEALLPSASSSVLLGIVGWNAVYAPGSFGQLAQDASPPGVNPDQMMEVINNGRIFAVMDGDAAVTPNVTRLYMRFETDGASNTTVGAFRNTDDGHVVDVRGQVKAIGPIFTAADGVTKICEVMINTNGLPT